jgi:hypothetical protein
LLEALHETLMVVAWTSFGYRPMRLINLLKVAPSIHGSSNVALSNKPRPDGTPHALQANSVAT